MEGGKEFADGSIGIVVWRQIVFLDILDDSHVAICGEGMEGRDGGMLNLFPCERICTNGCYGLFQFLTVQGLVHASS